MRTKSINGHIEKIGKAATICGNIYIDTNLRGEEFKASQAKEILEGVIRPLISHAKVCHVYSQPQSTSSSAILEKVSRKEKGKLVLDLSKELVRGNEKFWLGGKKERGTIVWGGQYEDSDLAGVFKDCFDPSALSNPGVLFNRTAIRTAKFRVEENPTWVYFLLSPDRTIGKMLILPSKSKIRDYVNLVLQNCKFSSQYIEGHDI